MKTIAVIGTGIMGSGIVKNFLKHHYPVVIWNRGAERTQSLQALGATLAATPREAAEQADLVFEVTANDESSKSVWLGEEGILAGMKKGTIAVSCATLSAAWADELIGHATGAGITFFDIPMTGGRVGAESGQLVLLAGGDEAELAALKPDLEAISQKVYHFGKAGSGMRFKLILNMLQGIHIAGLGEALRIARLNTMNIEAVGNALAERPGGTSTTLAWRDYQVEPDPINFSVQWITKDLRYAKELADTTDTPLLDDVLKKYEQLLAAGLAEADWTAINKN